MAELVGFSGASISGALRGRLRRPSHVKPTECKRGAQLGPAFPLAELILNSPFGLRSTADRHAPRIRLKSDALGCDKCRREGSDAISRPVPSGHEALYIDLQYLEQNNRLDELHPHPRSPIFDSEASAPGLSILAPPRQARQ